MRTAAVASARPERRAPALSLSLQAEGAALPVDRSRIRRWVVAALEHDAELAIRFVGRAEARRLNAAFRGKDYATNVLTFPYAQSPVVQADIAICLPVVEREAREQGKPLLAHLAHLVVHGVLHAQGYEHDADADAARMEAREVEVLRRFRIDDPYAPR